MSRNTRTRLPGLSLPAKLGDGRSAQFRYEWRLFGWILPAVALFLGLLGLIVPALPGDDTLEATGMLVAIFVYVAGALGLELGKSHFRKDDYRMTGFWAIRPLPDAALAATKLRMTAMSVAVGTVVFYLPLIGGWLLAGYGETLAALWQLLLVRGGSLGAGFIVLLAIGLVPWVSWVIAANLMAVCLSGHRMLGGRLMLLAGPVFLAVAWLVYRLSQSPIIVAFLVEHATPIGLLPTVAMVGLVVFLRRHFGRSWRSLLPRWALAGGGVLLVLLPWAVHQAFPVPFRSLVAVITVNLILAALLPLVTAPLALSVNRHRG